MPNTLEENVNRVKAAKTAIANAITAKGGTVGANDGLEDFASDIGTIPSGGGSAVEAKDVNFYDYDGTIVNSYTATEFANLSTFPENPSHEGLTAQGWNWDTLANAKAYVASYGKLDIGQMYKSNTSNGNTLLHIRLDEGRLKPYLGLTGNYNTASATIDWGDNSTPETVVLNKTTVYTPHEYSSKGDYVITISAPDDALTLGGANGSNIFRKSDAANVNYDRVYQSILIKAEIGSTVKLGTFAFQNCTSLIEISLPDTITTIPNNAFNNCYNLTSIAMPNSITTIENNAFSGCYSLKTITISSSITNIVSNSFSSTRYLRKILFPNKVFTIADNAFQYCYVAEQIILPNIALSLAGNAFSNGSSLKSIIIPNTITSIPYNFVSDCYLLTNITIPSSVTQIGSNAFKNCYGLRYIKFEGTTPPTVSNSNAWSNIPTDCIIYVPSGSLSDYTSAQYYPDPNTYTYVEY